MTAQRERERRERRERPIPRGVRLLCLRDDASRHRRNDASRRASPPSGEIGNGAGQVLGPAGRERGEGRVGRQGERASERARARERERERREHPVPRGVRLPCLRDGASRHRRNDASRREARRASERARERRQGPFPSGSRLPFVPDWASLRGPRDRGAGSFLSFQNASGLCYNVASYNPFLSLVHFESTHYLFLLFFPRGLGDVTPLTCFCSSFDRFWRGI